MMSAPLPDWIAAVMRAWRSLALIVSSVTSIFICLLYSAIRRLSSASPSGMKSTHCRRWSFAGWAKAGAPPPPAARSPSALEVLRKPRREIVVMCRLLASFGDQSDEARRRHMTTISRSEEHTSELQSRLHLVCRLLLEKKKTKPHTYSAV